MQDLTKLYVFTNSRKIREFNAGFQNELIPKSLNIAQFEKKALYVKDRFEADPIYLLVLMQKATAGVKEASLRLKIPTEFFAFLKNNDYLFSFFKELAIQKKSIKEIKFSDIYADYEEHLDILQNVLAAYKDLLNNENLYDDIILPEIYSVNESFIKSFSEIIIEIDGFLSEFEWEILQKISLLTDLKLIFTISKFNKKSTDKICSVFGLDSSQIELYARFELDVNKKVFTKIATVNSANVAQVRAFGLRSLQAAYAMEKVGEFMREGIAARDIAVVLPDESFSDILKLYDAKRMFNFAMGESFTHSKFFQILDLIVKVINDGACVCFNQKEADKYDEFSFLLDKFGVSEELFNSFKDNFEAPCEFEKFKELTDKILSLQNDARVRQIVIEAIFDAQNLARHFIFSLRQICEIFLMRLRKETIDDVGGGEVSVIGILESRGMKFKGVVIPDFNDDLIPKRSVNEMFLSSKVRERAGLIGYGDRENLQRFYYENLIGGAQKVAISYVLNEEKIASRFLNEFKYVSDEKYGDASYLRLLGSGNAALKNDKEEIILKHDFFAYPLSFSRLETFLNSPRLYYYKYILGVKEPKPVGRRAGGEYGKMLHNALFKYYNKFKEFDLGEFERILKEENFSALELEILLLKFKNFEASEKKRYAEGWRVKECEKSVKIAYCDGIAITGAVDRIDANGEEIEIIDYKSGNFDVKSLQLPFYQALLGTECKSYFYDLKIDMSLKPAKSGLDELREALNELKKINNTDINFSDAGKGFKSEAFKILCKGEL